MDRYLEGASSEQQQQQQEGLLGAAPPSALDIAAVPAVPDSAAGGAAAEGKAAPSAAAEGGEKKAELFYTVGSPELLEARKAMAAFSFQVGCNAGGGSGGREGVVRVCLDRQQEERERGKHGLTPQPSPHPTSQHAAARLARLRRRQELLSQRRADETPEAAAGQQRLGEA